MTGPRREPAGFTLLELLIALALLALLTTILLAGLRFEIRAEDRQSARLDRSSKIPVVYGFLRAHLSNARPILPVNSTGTTIVFDGRSADVTFVDAAPQGAQGGGLYVFTVNFATGQLRARWRPFEGTLPISEEGAGDTVLLDGIATANLQYFGAAGPTSRPVWQDQWRDASYLPLLIRFELTFIDGEHVPALVVAPRLRPLLAAVPSAPATNGSLR